MKRSKTDKSCKDGVNRPIETFTITSPIGDMTIKACSRGLHMINQADDVSDETFEPAAERSIELLEKPSRNKEVAKVVNACITWLKAYFFTPDKISNAALPTFCTISDDGKFQEQVQLILAENIGFGQTITYKDLAAMTKSPGAIRAAGAAMKSNPFQIMVPCHRVINSSAKMGKYSGGRRNDTKEWLLKHEGSEISNGIVIQDKAAK